ncbi:MAG: DUF4870 domain-containing protein [Chloroflexi bacterium]|nr:DUF4870 domain-containing protein [Chloroflexota bacterium]
MRNRNRTGEEKLWATLAHLMLAIVLMFGLVLPLLGVIALFVTMLIYYFKRRRSPWLAFQGLQALAFQAITFTIVALALLFLPSLDDSSSVVSPPLWLQVLLILVFFYAVMGATRCALGYNFRYPLIGRRIQQRFRVQEQ